jgi:hypothetical protein
MDNMRKGKKARAKKLAALVFVVSFLAISGNLWGQKTKVKEFSLGVVGVSNSGKYWFRHGAMISIGYNTIKGIGTEAGGIGSTRLSFGVLMYGNIVISPFQIPKFFPFATGGLWISPSKVTGWNVGFGLKLRVSESMALRAEFRRWMHFDSYEKSRNIILIGFSTFF